MNFFPFKRRKKNVNPGDIELDGLSIPGIIDRINSGDSHLKERFIKKYTPFILKTVSRAVGKNSGIEEMEEYSVALMAFDEAIRKFDMEKGQWFMGFCEQVIRSRIIDYQRKEKKYKNTYSFAHVYEENDFFPSGHTNNYELGFPALSSSAHFDNVESMDEILKFEEDLKKFRISIEEVARSSPRHKDSLVFNVRIARLLASNDELYGKMLIKRALPVKELSELADVHIRTIEKNRKFIIAVSLILRSNLSVLKSYIHILERGE